MYGLRIVFSVNAKTQTPDPTLQANIMYKQPTIIGQLNTQNTTICLKLYTIIHVYNFYRRTRQQDIATGVTKIMVRFLYCA